MSLEEDYKEFCNDTDFTEDDSQNEEEIFFHDEYYNQLLDDLSINILCKFRKYLDEQGLNICKKLSSTKIFELLQKKD